MHFDEIRQFEWILRLKMSKICIENKSFSSNLVLDTIFRTSKSLEQTSNNIFISKCTTGNDTKFSAKHLAKTFILCYN